MGIGGLQEELDALRLQQRSAEERESALHAVTQAIATSSFDLDVVLQTVTDRSMQLCQADYGNIALRKGDIYRVASFGSFSPEYERLVRGREYAPERGSLIGRTALERRVIHIDDVLEDPEYTVLDLQQAGKYRTMLGVPMLREGDPIGVIGLGRNEVRPFNDSEIRLIEAFAAHVVIALENVRLYETVERQRTELARFAPQVADLLSSDEGQQLLAGHRREITALFSDLRGFTTFAETAEPEEVLGVLRQYHSAVGDVIHANQGTVEHFVGDGLMAFFNDPKLLPDHAQAAIRSAFEIRDRFEALAVEWRKRGYELGIGMGVATGYATLGRIGFEGRYDYGAVGNVVILASRLSDVAGPGEILISQRTCAAAEDHIEVETAQELNLKGFSRPVSAVSVTNMRG